MNTFDQSRFENDGIKSSIEQLRSNDFNVLIKNDYEIRESDMGNDRNDSN
jgi:hypothetical protein